MTRKFRQLAIYILLEFTLHLSIIKYCDDNLPHYHDLHQPLTLLILLQSCHDPDVLQNGEAHPQTIK